jgi:hypothetical protein
MRRTNEHCLGTFKIEDIVSSLSSERMKPLRHRVRTRLSQVLLGYVTNFTACRLAAPTGTVVQSIWTEFIVPQLGYWDSDDARKPRSLQPLSRGRLGPSNICRGPDSPMGRVHERLASNSDYKYYGLQRAILTGPVTWQMCCCAVRLLALRARCQGHNRNMNKVSTTILSSESRGTLGSILLFHSSGSRTEAGGGGKTKVRGEG